MKSLTDTQFDLLLYFCNCDTGTDMEQVGFSGTLTEETGFFTTVQYQISFCGNKKDSYRLKCEYLRTRNNDLVNGEGEWQNLAVSSSQRRQIQAILHKKVSHLQKRKKDAEIAYLKNMLNTVPYEGINEYQFTQSA